MQLQTYLSEECLKQDMVWLQAPTSTQLDSYEVEAFRKTMPSFALLSLKGLCDRSTAELLRSYKLYIPANSKGATISLVEELAQWIGYQLLSEEKPIGTLTDVHPLPQNPLLSVRDEKERTYLIPAHADFITNVDHSTGCIHVKLPEGLLELT